MTHIPIPTLSSLFSRSSRAASEVSVGWVALVVMLVAGSTYNSFAKQLTGALSPLTMLLISEALMGLFAGLSFGILPTVRKTVHLPPKSLWALFAIGLVNGVVGLFLWFSGLHMTTAINAELMGKGTEMVLLPLLALLFLRQSLHRHHIIAGVLIFSGVLMIVLQGFSESFIPHRGDFILLAAAFFFSIGNIIFCKFLHKIEPQIVIFTRSVCSVGAFFIVSAFVEHAAFDELASLQFDLILVAIGFGFISRFIYIFSFYEAMDHLPVSTVSLFGAFMLTGGVTFAWMYLGEELSWYHFAGGSLVLLGMILLEVMQKKYDSHLHEKQIEQRMTQKP